MISAVNSPVSRAAREISRPPGPEEFLRAHYRFQDGRFFTEVHEESGAIHCVSDIAIPMWNHTSIFGGEVDQAGIEAWHAKHHRRPVVYLIEDGVTKAPAGFEKFDRETWMVRSVDLEDSVAADLQIESATDLREFTAVFRSAFSANSAAYEAALRRGEQKHLIARLDGEAVAVGTVIGDGELACIYNVGTIPQARGRGVGRAMMLAAIQAAREDGCGWVFLQVESGSGAERLYLKLGFEPLFTRAGYRRADWNAEKPIAHESALSRALGFNGKISANATEGRETCAIPDGLKLAIEGISQTEDLPVKTIFVGLWSLLLSRYLNPSEISDSDALSWIRNHADIAEPSVALRVDEGSFNLEYRAELFSKGSMRRMAGHYLTLLESFARDPKQKARELEILTAAEKRQLIEWSDGGAISWCGETIVELIEARSKQTPSATALILGDENRPQLTYADLMRKSAERACALIQARVTPKTAVGVLLPRSLDMVVSMLATWRAGGVFVPLDSSYPASRIQFIADDCGMKAVITCQALAHLAPRNVPKIFVDSDERFEAAPIVRVEPTDPAYVIYTSGSTGQPKGVSISHGAIARHTLAMIDYYEIGPSDRHLHFSPFTFDASFEQLLPPLVAGASVVVRDEHLWDVSEFIRNIDVFGLTMIDVPMAYWRQLAQDTIGMSRDRVPDKLRLIIAGGEAMASDRLAQWQQGPFGDRRLVNAYGPTEATVTATAFEAADFKATDGNSVPIGCPLAGRSAFILDGAMQPVPVRVVGQLYLGGPLLASGYLNRDELTRQKFVKNPFDDGQLYATGDMARFWEDGTIEFLGRADDQVKIRGFRIELGEIEVALQEHPSVREAVVVAKDDGVGQKRLIGYVTPRNGAIKERELRQWLRDRLPDYMAPSAIVSLKELPLLSSGKVNRKALPDSGVVTTIGPAVTPKTPLELQLQILFQRVLRRSGVGVDESFFELGGDSLQALELIVQIEKATGRRLPLEMLFQTPSVQRLAAELQRAGKGDDWSCLVTLQKSGTRPPLFLVHTTPGDVLGYGNLIHHLGPDQPCYGFQALGFKDDSEPHTTIETMAAHYVELLRKFQPSGPYFLGGWCFGGIVAVEMAQQLMAVGQQVAPLLLLETISVPPGPGNFKYHAARLKCLFSMSPERWREYLRAKAKYRHQVELDNRMRFRQAGENVDPEQRRWLERLEQVYNANLAALDVYQSRYFDGKVILFNAIDKDPGILPDPNYGWTGLAKEIEIHEVAGDHDTMLAEPNVSSLAAAIRKVLS